MKKWVLMIILTTVLVGCNNETANDSKESVEDSKTTEIKEKETATDNTTTNNLDVEDALQIANNIESAIGYVWSNVELLGLSGYDMFNPAVHYEPVIERFKAFATDNYLDAEYIENFRSLCYACDANTLGYSLYNSDNHKVTIIDEHTFSLFAHRPADWYYYEMNITKTFKFVDGQWKIDNEEIEVLSEEPFDMDAEVETASYTPTGEFQTLYDQAVAIFTEHTEYNSYTDDSLADQYAHKYELIESAKAILEQLEDMAKSKDPYFGIHTSVFNKVLADAVAYSEQDTMGGSMQPAFMLDTEARLLEQRLYDIYYSYKEKF